MVEVVDHTIVFRILQSQQLKPYHVQNVQALKNVNYEQRNFVYVPHNIVIEPHLFGLCYVQ